MFNFPKPTISKEVLCGIMRSSNFWTTNLAKKFNISMHQLRQIHFGKTPEDVEDETFIAQIFNSISSKVHEGFEAIKAVENEVLANYGRLALKIAKTFYLAEKTHKATAQFEDYAQEALMGLIDASYGYTEQRTKFSTYASWSIRNKLINYVERHSSDLSSIKRRVIKIRQTVMKLMNSQNKSFDEACETLDLSETQKKEVMESLVQVASEVNWDFVMADYDFTPDFDNTAMVALQTAEMTDFERDVLLAKINDEKISDVAKRYGVTRMAGSQALGRATQLVRARYRELTKDAA